MAALIGNPMLLTSAPADDDAYQIEKSIRFNKDDTPNLSRNLRKGNRRTWTLSCWVKRSDNARSQRIFSCGVDGNNYTNLDFTSSDNLYFQVVSGNSNACQATTSDKCYRDPSAWYHIVLAVDTTQATATDRVKIFVNGKKVPLNFGTTPNQYLETDVSESGVTHKFGQNAYNASGTYDGYLADVQFIDNLALSPAAFGSFDDSNCWHPKTFALPAPNDGRTWSTSVDPTTTNTSSTYNFTKVFDGIENDDPGQDNNQNAWQCDTANAVATATLGTPIEYNTSLRAMLRVDSRTNGGTQTNNVCAFTTSNRGRVPHKAASLVGANTLDEDYWLTIDEGKGSLSKCEIGMAANAGYGFSLWCLEVDGVRLEDGVTDPTTRTNPNDGTKWTDGTETGTGISGSWNNVFDGNATTEVASGNSGAWGALELPKAITWTNKLRVAGVKYSTDAEVKLTINGTETDYESLFSGSVTWQTISTSAGSLTKLKVKSENGTNDRGKIYAIEVDGQVVINEAFDNSFQLKFNDTSLYRYLGKDTLNGKIADATGGKPILTTTDDYGDVKGSGTAADSDSANLLLAVPFDTTTATDYHATIKGSGTNRTLTTSTSNVAYAATTDARFYGSAANLALGNGGGIKVAGVTTTTNTDDFEVGTGDFTVEFWAKWDPEATGNSYIFSLEKTGGASPYPLYLYRKSNGEINNWNDAFDVKQWSNAGSDGEWHHYALVRNNSGKTFTGYLDGNKDTVIVRANAYDMPANVDKVSIGHYNNGYAINGLLQEVRFYNKAKYTANFKSPARADFTPSGLTIGTSTGTTTGGSWNTGFRDGNGGSWNAADVHEISTGATLSTNGNQNKLYIDTASLGDSYELTITDTGGANAIYFAEQDDDDPDATSNWNLIQNNVTKLVLTPGGANCDGTGQTHKRYVRCEGAGSGHVTMTITGVLDLDEGTSSSVAGIDSLTDTPTNYGTDAGAGGEVRGNFCTWNPLDRIDSGNVLLTQGNTKIQTPGHTTSATAYGTTRGTLGVTSGKWYWEIDAYTQHGSTGTMLTGVIETGIGLPQVAGDTGGMAYNASDGKKWIDNTNTSYGDSYTTGDVIGVALDMDNGAIYFSKNGTWQASGVPTSGASRTNAANTWTAGTKSLTPGISDLQEGSGRYITASLNAGQRAWKYTAPTDYKALCTQNLPDTFSGDELNNPSKYFDTKIWTGDSTERDIGGYNFGPDFVWIKCRDEAKDHVLQDQIRGGGNILSSAENYHQSQFTNGSDPESAWGSVKTFNSDGFTLQDGPSGYDKVNLNDENYVGWAWDAGTSTVTNEVGDINASVRANPDSGCSIIKFTSNDTDNQEIGHGLNAAPSLIIIKNIEAVEDWWVIHEGCHVSDPWNDRALFLNSNAAITGSWGTVNNQAPTNTVVNISNSTTTAPNDDTNEKIMYCFAAIPGFSAFGGYDGGGGKPFIYTGFRPKFVMIRATTNGRNWLLLDSERFPYNGNMDPLYANTNVVEQNHNAVDFLSNGFKIVNDGYSDYNVDDQITYAAWAEHPFKTSRAR